MPFPLASSRLKSSTAAGALAAALITSAPAQAADSCGPLQRGVVTCESSEGPFQEGIVYTSPGGMIVHLEDGLSVAPDAGNWGVALVADGGSLLLDGANANVSAQDSTAISAIAAGDVAIKIGDVVANGMNAWGIATFTYDGDTSISASDISTAGDLAYGVIAESVTGNIAISAGSVATSGYSADGITAFTGGDIDIQAGSISGDGDFLWGVNANSGGYADGQIRFGDTNVDVGSVAIRGDHAVGVSVVSYGSASVKVDELAIDGDFGNGIVATALGDVSLEVGNAEFTGQYSGGVVALGYGTATVKIGTLTAENGGGVVALGAEGAHVEAEKIMVKGEFANGIQSVSMVGDATVKAGSVHTNGFFGVGINGDAMKGDLVIEAGRVATQGDYAMGIRAFGRTSSIRVTGPLSTTGEFAFGINNATIHGDAVVRTTGTVTTAGDWADALLVVGRYGTADIKTTGKVSTSGANAIAIHAEGEDGQVKVAAGDVATSGDASDGIHARTRFVEWFLGQPPFPDPVEFSGDIDIVAEAVKVTGAQSTGISARGLGAARIDAGSVSASDNHAIETNMIGDSFITVRKAATSTLASAILARGKDVKVTIGGGADVAGGVHGIVVKALGARCVERNPIDGSPNPCPNPGDNWTYPDTDPVPAGPPGLATIDNAGSLSAGSGYAVMVESGTLTLNNSGTIKGAVLLGAGNDVVSNSGSFIVQKDSDFGAGNDLFRNSGTLAFGASAAPSQRTLAGLERFENMGKIDLRNGTAGDRLVLPGTYAGSGGSALALDVDFASGKADKLLVAGAATGTTEVAINATAGNARLVGSTALALAQVGAGSSADAFVIAEDARDVGFVRYGLDYDAATRSYLLTTAAGGGAHRQLAVLEGLRSNWHAAADSVRANVTAARDMYWETGDADPRRGRPWGQVQGGRGSRKGETRGSIRFDYDQERTGAQLGFDFAGRQGEGTSFRFGLTAGYADSTLKSEFVEETTSIETLNLGVHASFVSGSVFGSVLAQYDRHDVRFDSEAAGFEVEADGSTFGVEIEAGAHFAVGPALFVEPVASLAWTKTSLDDLKALGQALDFDGSAGARGKLGMRVKGNSRLGGLAARYHGSAKAVRDLGGRDGLTLVSGAEEAEVGGERLGTFGEIVLGGALATKGGVEAFVEGQGEFGSDYDSLEGRVGVRFKL